MPWRPSSQPRPGSRGAQGIRQTQRLGIVVVLAAVLVASLVSVAFASAGVFGSQAALGRAAHARKAPGRQAARRAQAREVNTTRASTSARQPLTSCTSVAHIGDSTSVGMVSPASLPDPAQRLAAQYADVGVRHVQIDASGGRSIVEEMPGQANGYRVATAWYQAGFRGCWVFALGTNDTANVAAGSSVSLLARIQEMMAAVHGEPVMWVNTQTDLTSGPWSEANMQLWNAALLQAARQYPNMRIFNWAGMVQPGWHLSDGIHYTPTGYAIRAAAIAGALARAFPLHGHSAGTVVG